MKLSLRFQARRGWAIHRDAWPGQAVPGNPLQGPIVGILVAALIALVAATSSPADAALTPSSCTFSCESCTRSCHTHDCLIGCTSVAAACCLAAGKHGPDAPGFCNCK